MKFFSRLGLWLAGGYLMFAVASIVIAFMCHDAFCGVSQISFLMSWPFELGIFSNRLENFFRWEEQWYGVLIANFLNIVIVYFLSVLIESLIKKIKSRNNQLPLN
jgi:hypothetical protein